MDKVRARDINLHIRMVQDQKIIALIFSNVNENTWSIFVAKALLVKTRLGQNQAKKAVRRSNQISQCFVLRMNKNKR